MLRRIPYTPLVCLAIFLLTILATPSWAASPEQSSQMLLAPDAGKTTSVPAAPKTAMRPAVVPKAGPAPAILACPPPFGVTKVRPVFGLLYGPRPACILPEPLPGQWEIGAQVFFARVTGKLQWPRYSSNYYGYAGQGGDDWLAADFSDSLMLPKHAAIVEIKAKYQFRPNWAVRYSVIPFALNGGGVPDASRQFVFGNFLFTSGLPIQTKWQHAYHRVGLVYDAVRTCTSKISVFADWVHVDDRIDVNCSPCSTVQQTFSKNTDSSMVGLEFRRCLATTSNGATFSCDSKAGAVFLDDVEGWDVELGGRYSIPLNNAARWGYMKGGYRLVNLKKSQSDFLLKDSLEGGFMELGFIF
jgi:hypothetical protein